MATEIEIAGAPLAPGPTGRPLVGNLPEMAPPTTRMALVMGWQRTYGEIVRMRLGRRINHIVSSPDAIKHVLVDRARNYPKSPEYDKLRAFLGNGLFTSEGESWLRNRRMLQPYFHLKYIQGLLHPMVACTRDMLARWEATAASQEPFDVAAEMMALTLRIVGETLLSTDVTANTGTVAKALAEALDLTNKRLFLLAEPPDWVPTKDNRRFRAARAALDEVVYGVIRERRANPIQAEGRGDLLAMLLAARDEETGEGMNDQQLRDEVMTIFLAGHETTAVALSWVWVLLSRYPMVERKAREELDTVLGGRTPTLEDLGKLTYLGMVIDEAMRLLPPVYVIQRIALEDDVLGGYRIQAGERVAISIYATHHNPRVWENPEGFDPERFHPDRAAGRHRFAFLPFGGGGRICIGNNFALMEAKLILALVMQTYRLELLPEHVVVPRASVTLRAQNGVRMRLRPVNPG